MEDITKVIRDNRIQNAIRLICVIAIAAMFTVSFAVYKTPVKSLLILIVYFVFYVQIPGMLISYILGLDRGHISTRLIFGAMLGWILIVGEYFATDAIENRGLLYACGPVMSAFYIWLVMKKRKTLGNEDRHFHITKLSTAFCIFLVLTLLYCLLNTQYLYPNPEIDQIIYVNPDKAFHMGLVNSLSHDYPLQAIWYSGVYFYYHIFTEILFAVPLMLFHVRADAGIISFTPILTTYIFGVSLYGFFREMSSKPDRAGIYCLITLLSNMFIAKSISTSIAWFFILRNDNVAGYAVSASIVFIIVFKKWYEAVETKETEKADKYKLAISCVLMIMLATGIKGTVGALLVASMWGTIVLGILLRKTSVKFIPMALAITAGFLLVYIVVIGAKGQANSSTAPALELAAITDVLFWKVAMVDSLKAAGIPTIFRYIALMITFLISFYSVFLLPFVIGYVKEIILVLRGKRDYNLPRIMVYATCMVGMLAMLLLYFEGNSEIYFGLVSLMLTPIVSFWYVEDLDSFDRREKKGFPRALIIVMSLTLVFTSLMLGKTYAEGIRDAVKCADVNKSHNQYMSMSNGEYQAMKWLEANAEENALVASDRYYSISLKRYSYKNRWKNRFFMYEAYSNRLCYISGSGYVLHEEDNPKRLQRIENVNKLHDEGYADRGKLARDLGINYVILSKKFSGERHLENDDYELCFSNQDVDIYRIR